MISVQILEDNDTIQATDWCRPLNLITMSGGHSDYYSFSNTYTGRPENNVKWVRVGDLFDAWIGKTVKEYSKISVKTGIWYEFVRGEVPISHQLHWK